MYFFYFSNFVQTLCSRRDEISTLLLVNAFSGIIQATGWAGGSYEQFFNFLFVSFFGFWEATPRNALPSKKIFSCQCLATNDF